MEMVAMAVMVMVKVMMAMVMVLIPAVPQNDYRPQQYQVIF